MSAAAATAEGAPPAKGKKKLIVILAAVLVLALAGGGGAVFMLKKKAAAEAAAAEEDAEDGGQAASKGKPKADAKHDAAHPPTFLPLEPFVVNLADKDADRYGQIGVTLEVEDAKAGDEIKAYMPAIRNGILMVLAHKTSAELLTREGKEKLAAEIMRESVRPLGIELEEPEDDEPAADDKPKKKKKKRKSAQSESPVKHVHFSNFIIQ